MVWFLKVKAVYLAACHLKIDRVARRCAQHLIKYLSVDNCIEIRSLSGIARNKEFVQQVDAFIAKEVCIESYYKGFQIITGATGGKLLNS